MKTFKLLLLLIVIAYAGHTAYGQKTPNITSIEFEEEAIILNNDKAYNYSRTGNSFVITNLNGEELVKGEITPLGKGKFSSIITFIEVDKQFSHPKIVGRNDLIFALCEFNVIEKDFTFNIKKLNKFIKKYNKL